MINGKKKQTSFLTPPFGFTLFYMRGIAPAEITTRDIWHGATPWTVLQLAGLAIVWFAPQTATALPAYLFRQKPPEAGRPMDQYTPHDEPAWDDSAPPAN